MGKSLIKKILFLVTVGLTSLVASEEFGFVGIGIGYQQIDPGIFETNHTTFGIRAGRQSLNWRAVFGLNYEKDLHTVFVEADYIFLDEMFGTPKLRPYLGLNFNYIDYDNFYDYSRDINIDEQGYSMGINIGLIIYAGDRVDIDIGYHYNSVLGIEPVDYLQALTLGIHYFY